MRLLSNYTCRTQIQMMCHKSILHDRLRKFAKIHSWIESKYVEPDASYFIESLLLWLVKSVQSQAWSIIAIRWWQFVIRMISLTIAICVLLFNGVKCDLSQLLLKSNLVSFCFKSAQVSFTIILTNCLFFTKYVIILT